ncbi:hypothetical protein BC936DRAFT_145183, partial [Jimgerdemannia flammicorona]
FLPRDDDPTLSNAESVFYEWLEKPLPEDEREDVGLVELHQFGNEVVRAIERDRLVMLVPTYLLDEIGWYTNKLGICLYVRRLLIDDELWQLNEILVGNYTTFHGVEQRIVVDDTAAVVVSGADGEDDESGDEDGKVDDYERRGGRGDGENELPVYRSQWSALRSGKCAAVLPPNHELSEFGSSSSGSKVPSNRRDLGKGSSFSGSREGSVGTSDDNDKGGNGGDLPRTDESNSAQSVTNRNSQGVVSGAGGEDDEPSDGSDDEDGKADGYDRSGQGDSENELPVYQPQLSAARSGKRAAGLSPNHELSEFGGSISGSEVPSNHRDPGNGSSFSYSRTGSVGTSGDNNKGGSGGDLPRADERNSAQSVNNFIWQGLCVFLCIFTILRWPAVLLIVFFVWFFHIRTMREFEDGLNPNYDESSSAGDSSQVNRMTTITPSVPLKSSNSTSEESQIAGSSSIKSTDISNKRIVAAELPPSTEKTADSAGRAIVNNYPETTVERGNNVAGCIINGPVDLSVKNFNSSRPEGLEDPKFTIDVSTSSTAVYKNRTQEFTLGFKLKVMITQSSHQFELSNIVLGATEHLVKNKRYYFNNFIIKITPCNARVACPNAHPEEAIRHWKMKQSSGTDGIKWCHNVDKPAIRAENLRYQFGTYSTKYKWESYGPEPTEYLVDLNVGLTFFKSNFKDIRGGGNDYDLINSVSIRIKNIRKHGKVIVTPRTPGLTWMVAANVEMNRRELFWHLSSFAECQNCCELEAGIRPVNAKSSLTRTINNWRNLSFRGSRLT